MLLSVQNDSVRPALFRRREREEAEEERRLAMERERLAQQFEAEQRRILQRLEPGRAENVAQVVKGNGSQTKGAVLHISHRNDSPGPRHRDRHAVGQTPAEIVGRCPSGSRAGSKVQTRLASRERVARAEATRSTGVSFSPNKTAPQINKTASQINKTATQIPHEADRAGSLDPVSSSSRQRPSSRRSPAVMTTTRATPCAELGQQQLRVVRESRHASEADPNDASKPRPDIVERDSHPTPLPLWRSSGELNPHSTVLVQPSLPPQSTFASHPRGSSLDPSHPRGLQPSRHTPSVRIIHTQAALDSRPGTALLAPPAPGPRRELPATFQPVRAGLCLKSVPPDAWPLSRPASPLSRGAGTRLRLAQGVQPRC